MALCVVLVGIAASLVAGLAVCVHSLIVHRTKLGGALLERV